MTAKYKTPGKKEFKKINYLKEKLLDSDPYVRKQALFIYNQIIKTSYDKEIEDVEKEIYQKEKFLRLSDKKREKDKILNSLKNPKNEYEDEQEDENEVKPDSSDNYVNSELTALKFKLKYLNQLKDIEIDKNIDKTRVLIK
ncbi:MAG: hypothetical protein U0354_06410 [Candidatus Sericytochromatia bacterium]